VVGFLAALTAPHKSTYNQVLSEVGSLGACCFTNDRWFLEVGLEIEFVSPWEAASDDSGRGLSEC